MSSQQSSLPVPQINTIPSSNSPPTPPGRISPKPEIAYFSPHPRTQPRATSPLVSPRDSFASPSLGRTPTVDRLRTPESQSMQDPTYFASRSSHPQSRHTRTTSPSENLSNPLCFSPGLSSSGSYYSSDVGQSPCSYSSAEFLTPPQERPDTDNPPYKARRSSSGSLTMIHKLQRYNTTPYDREHKCRKRHRKHRKHQNFGQKKIKLDEHQHRSYWWFPSACQVAPTAPSGQKQLCEGHAGHNTPRKTRHGNTDTYRRLRPELRSKLAPAVVTRRWSSVEIGAHQIVLESTFPLRSTVPTVAKSSSQVDQFVPMIIGKRYRSSTFTRGAINHDIVRTVRDKLTLRKLPGSQIVTPTSITLRRASGESGQSYQNDMTGESTPLAWQPNSLQRRLSAAYLITSQDIDSITELIEANLRRSYNTYGRHDVRGPGLTPPSKQGTPSPSITSKGVVPTNSSQAELAVTVVEVQTTSIRPRSPLNFLQVVPASNEKDTISRTDSQRSAHEVIWQEGGSPQSTQSASSVTDEEDTKRSLRCDYSSESSSPAKSSLSHQAPRPDKGVAFDPKNANASINEWSWRCPQSEIAVVVTSSDSDSNDRSSDCNESMNSPRSSVPPNFPRVKGKGIARVRPSLRSARSETKLQDVVSFPPLPPRKKTNDWHSPLPPMETSRSLTISRSLYDIGIDVSFGPESSKTITPKSSQTSWVRSAELSPSRSIEFNPSYEIRSKSPELCVDDQIRRESVLRADFSASARIGDSSTVRSSMGTSSGEKRQSSTPSIQRTRSSRLCESPAVRSLLSTASGERRTSQSQIQGKEPPRLSGVFGTELSPTVSSDAVRLDERRRSSTPGLQRIRTIDNIHKGEHAPPTKWRAPSPFPSLSSLSQSEYVSEYETARESRGSSPCPGANTTQAKRSWVDRLSLIRARSPPLPAIDRVGIYGRMTGGQNVLRRDPCGEASKSEPHVCDDCPMPREPYVCDDLANDPRNPSVDWIG